MMLIAPPLWFKVPLLLASPSAKFPPVSVITPPVMFTTPVVL